MPSNHELQSQFKDPENLGHMNTQSSLRATACNNPNLLRSFLLIKRYRHDALEIHIKGRHETSILPICLCAHVVRALATICRKLSKEYTMATGRPPSGCQAVLCTGKLRMRSLSSSCSNLLSDFLRIHLTRMRDLPMAVMHGTSPLASSLQRSVVELIEVPGATAHDSSRRAH